MGLLHPGLPSTLQVAPELPGALEVVLRSSHLADVETENKASRSSLGFMGLWEGSRRRSQILEVPAPKMPGCYRQSWLHMPQWRTPAVSHAERGHLGYVSASQPSSSDTIKGILLSGGKSDPH